MDSVRDTTILALAPTASFQSLGDSAVILSLDSGQLFTCNETTESLLRKIDGQRTYAEIIDDILREYDVNRDVLQSDILEIVDNLIAEGIVLVT